MTATITPLPRPTRPPNPATDAALAELLQLGLAVARAASHLAQAETAALGALAESAAETARALLAPAASLADALKAGHNADASDAARDAIAARIASVTHSFDKAARAVRRTAALQARLADPRPFHHPPSSGVGWASAHNAPPGPTPNKTQTRPASDAEPAERPDTPETGNELGAMPDDEVLRGIHHDLATAKRSLRVMSAEPTATAATPHTPAPTRPAPRHPPAETGTTTPLWEPPGAPNPPPRPDT